MKKLDLTNTPENAAKKAVDETKEMSQNQESDSKNKKVKKEKEETMSRRKKIKPTLIVLCVIAVLAGTGTGYGAYRLRTKSSGGTGVENGPEPMQQVAQEGTIIKKGDVFGVKDENTFKDRAEGYLEDEGINGEGSHKLLRPGGETQTVYLTSSVTDLDKFIGMEVKIWGETFKGQQAGWLMDVGRVEILNPKAEAPVED